VRLSGTNYTGGSTQTDEDGNFRFNGLEAGPYTITVEGGTDYDTAVENVDIYREASPGGRILQVPIYLKPKGATAAMFADVPKDAVELYKKGVDEARSGNAKKAVENLNKAVAADPNFGLAQAELGTQYMKLGQVDKAIEPLTKAVELMPRDFHVHLNLGVALMNKKDFMAAEKQLREAIAINNAVPAAHMYLGIVLVSTIRDKDQKFIPERWTEAQSELETATKTGKDEVAQAHKYLAGVYAGNKDYKRGADELELYLKLVPKAPDAEKLKATVKEWRTKD
jgi:Tfp pilus assembly protein PilF